MASVIGDYVWVLVLMALFVLIWVKLGRDIRTCPKCRRRNALVEKEAIPNVSPTMMVCGFCDYKRKKIRVWGRVGGVSGRR